MVYNSTNAPLYLCKSFLRPIYNIPYAILIFFFSAIEHVCFQTISHIIIIKEDLLHEKNYIAAVPKRVNV